VVLSLKKRAKQMGYQLVSIAETGARGAEVS
jgi:hypothetical protein